MLKRFDAVFLQSILGAVVLAILSGCLLASEIPIFGLLLGILTVFRLTAALVYLSLQD